jgi:hypothetical protein
MWYPYIYVRWYSDWLQDWTIEGSEFESRYGQEFSLFHVVQTGSGADAASYPIGTGGSFPEGKAAGACR